MNTHRRPELGKWLLHRLYVSDPLLKKHLPVTHRYSRTVAIQMAKQYSSLYVKPVAGERGRGVLRLYRTGTAWRTHKENHTPITHASLDKALSYIDAERGGRMYIVQQDVKLARIADRPFDVRIMMQKDGQWQWHCTGLCAKVAGPHSAVTNVLRSRGTVITVPAALTQSLGFDAARIETVEKGLKALGHATCRCLETYQPYSEIGVDAGIDNTGRIWMLEANTGPSHALFRHLKDQSMYLRIQRTWQERRRARRTKKTRTA